MLQGAAATVTTARHVLQLLLPGHTEQAAILAKANPALISNIGHEIRQGGHLKSFSGGRCVMLMNELDA